MRGDPPIGEMLEIAASTVPLLERARGLVETLDRWPAKVRLNRQPDVRATMRRALRTGGEPIHRAWYTPTRQPRRLVNNQRFGVDENDAVEERHLSPHSGGDRPRASASCGLLCDSFATNPRNPAC